MHLKKLTRSSARPVFVVIVVALLIGSSLVSFTGAVTAQEQLGIEINAPSEATTGDAVTVSSSVSVPDLLGEYETQISIALAVDGERVATKTITVQDGGTATVSFNHVFESSGTHTLEVQAETTLSGQTFSNSVSRTIDITAPETSVPTTTSSISTGGQTTVEGASFSTPDSLKEDVQTYREQAPLDLPGNAFVLGTQDDLYLVFTHTEPKKGLATVTGVTPGNELSIQGQSFTVLVASSTAFRTDGESATVSDVTENPEAHQLDLVRIQATHRRVSTLTDTDQANDPTVAVSTGVLVENPTTATEMFTKPGQQATSLVLNASSDKLGSNGQEKANSLLNADTTGLVTVDFDTRFWADTEGTVDGIVLTPGSKARDFVTTFDRRNIIPAGPDQPLLYVVDSRTASTQYDSVSALKSNAKDGDVVSVQANLHGQTYSVQETLEHSTPCSQEAAQVPSPSGPICVDMVQDTLIHTGVAWTAVPETQDDVLLVVGLSSRELDTPATPLTGEYQIVGEVHATSRVDDSLPEGKILIVSDLERTSESDYSSISDESRVVIDSRVENLQAVVTAQLNDSSTQQSKTTTETESTQTSSNTNSGHQNGNTDDSSVFGIDFSDWFSEDGEGILSDVLKGISDIFESDEK